MHQESPELRELYTRLGLRRLSRTWAKLEILLGLAAAGAGLLCGISALTQVSVQWAFLGAGWSLFVLGSYLALAGHRSHLYQSSNELTAYLTAVIRERDKVPHEHPD
jgi:hypothetical protein